MDFELTDEQQLIRDAVREFAETEVRPHVHEMDEKGIFKPEIIQKFFELGLMAIEIPEQYGGSDGGIFLSVLAIEELSRVDAAAAIYVDVHNTLVNNCILRWANDELKEAEAAGRFAKKMHTNRNAYINKAVRYLNRVNERKTLSEQYRKDALAAQGSTAEVIREFESFLDEGL